MSLATPALDDAPAQAAVASTRTHIHVPALDGIRGCAILLVVINHIVQSLQYEWKFDHPVLSAMQLGWSGVDLFFVLSGFLITGILYDAKEGQGFFKNFYARRALRIFPLYYLALIIVLIMSALWPHIQGAWGNTNPAWMWVYLTNFVLADKGGGAFGVVDHFWSLAVEEHFYFVWPTVVFFLDRKRLMWAAAAALVIALALRIWVAIASPDSYGAYVLTPMRMDALAAGALLALLARGPSGLQGLLKPALVVGALAAAGFLSIVIGRHTVDPYEPVMNTVGLSLLWLLFGSALVVALTWKPATGVMSSPVLRWFGKYSYGMYVWHPIVFVLMLHTDAARAIRGGNDPLHIVVSTVLAVAVMVGVTMASWHLVEKQFLKLKTRFE